MQYEVMPSQHLRFGTEGKFIYHALFGNLCRIDGELGGYLAGQKDKISYGHLEECVGQSISRELLNNYFFVESPEEERVLIETWMEQRQKLLPTGYFLEALQVSSSNLCNFACSYCFADTSDRRSALRHEISSSQPTLKFETGVTAIDALLSNARIHGRNRVGVKFLGREPLINWRVIKQLLTHYQDSPIQWSMTTNGSLIDSDIAAALKRADMMVVVSIDGPPQVNNSLRVLKTQGSSYDLAMQGVKQLAQAHVRFGVSSVVSDRFDFDSYSKFVKLLAAYGARELELTLVMQNSCNKAQRHAEGQDALIDFLVDIYKLGKSLGVMIHGDWIDPFYRILSTHKRRDESVIVRNLQAGCSATSHQISLESSGDLFPCRAMSLHYGHIDDLESIFKGEAYRSVGMRTLLNVPYCRGCDLEGFCQGTCLGSCEEASNDIYQPQEEYCEIYRRASERLFLSLL